MLTKEEELELIDLLEKEQAAKAYNSLATYAELTLEFKPAAHHLLLIDALESVERKEIDLLIVTMPPGSAKSHYGSRAFVGWYLGRHPNHNVIAASHTQELADTFGRRVRNLVGSEGHQRIFKECKLSSDSSAVSRWATQSGGEYFGAGVGGSVTGRRADLVVIDDPVKSREDADSETVREKQWAWWRDDISTRLKPNAGVVLIMTRWHEDDLAGRMIADNIGTGVRVKLLSLPMEAEDDDPLGRQVGEPLWAEWFTDQMREVAKRDPRTWSALYQQRPRPIGGGEFKIEWLSYWTRQPATLNKVILVDPSSGKSKKRGDYTSMWVVGRGADGNDYVIDGVRDRLNLTERTEKLFELVLRHKPACVAYESYGLQADIEHITLEQERNQYRFKIIEVGGAEKKEDRIRKLIPTFQQGRMWMPMSMLRQCADGNQRDIMDDFKAEYLAFPVSAHDDMMDCLARKEDSKVSKFLVAPQAQQKQAYIRGFEVLDDEMNY